MFVMIYNVITTESFNVRYISSYSSAYLLLQTLATHLRRHSATAETADSPLRGAV